MVIEMTHAQLLQEWRLRYLHEPVNDDCPYTRHDGIDIDRLLAGKMRDWYLDLLDNAPLSILAPMEIHDRITNQIVDDEGCLVFKLPDECRRLIAVRAEGCTRDAAITSDLSSRTAQLQLSPYTRGDTHHPVAVIDNREVRLYSVKPGSAAKVEKLLAIVDTPGIYRFDEKALSTIPSPDF
ncbi:hypothetical protein [uncultured Muribaculum sp.]|jgi:hypothetical protein|nr:hypothetical protein [uncultured Muribaculum sp.]